MLRVWVGLMLLGGLTGALWALGPGECVQGDCQEGQGQMRYESGATYEGSFQQGHPSGQGVYAHPGGIHYEGSFQQGHFHGEGVLTSEDGRSYSGSFEEGAFHGYGEYRWPDGAIYTGEFDEGHFHEGVLQYPDGTRRHFTPED